MEKQRIRSLIVEDEVYDRQLIEKILASYYDDYIDVVDSVSTVEDALASIKKNNPQLLFMDIELNGDREGAFKILENVDNKSKIIFVTAKSSQDDLLRAIKLSCIDYLIKPTKISDFEIPIKKVYQELYKEEKDSNQKIANFKHNVKVHDLQEAKISLQEGFSYRPTLIKEIIRCEAQGNYTSFFFTNNTTTLINGNLKSFEERLSDYGFCRINKSELINLTHIRTFSRKNASWEILLEDKTVRYISTQRKHDFMAQYNKFHLS